MPPPEGFIVAADVLSDTLSVIDASSAELVTRAPVGRDPVDVDGPVALLFDGQRRKAYVALAYPVPPTGVHANHEPHPKLGWIQRLSLDDLSIDGEAEVDVEPSALALSEDGARLVVVHGLRSGLDAAKEEPEDLDLARARLRVVDPESLEVSSASGSARACVVATDLALSRRAGEQAFVSCYGEDSVAIVDVLDKRAPVVRVPVDASPGAPGEPLFGPVAVALSPDGTTLAVANALSADVRFLDVRARTVDAPRTAPVGATPQGLAFSRDGARVFLTATSPDRVLALNARTGAILVQRDFAEAECPSPARILEAESGALIVTCSGDGVGPGRVAILDASLTSQEIIEAGRSPRAVGILGP